MGKTVAERVINNIQPKKGRFHGDISDLFFNTDVENCRVIARGEFKGWDEKLLRMIAKEFLNSLSRLGVGDLPSVDELIADFYSRI